ncbi:hypothetical protein YC2023_113015 [Brassica napus]
MVLNRQIHFDSFLNQYHSLDRVIFLGNERKCIARVTFSASSSEESHDGKCSLNDENIVSCVNELYIKNLS